MPTKTINDIKVSVLLIQPGTDGKLLLLTRSYLNTPHDGSNSAVNFMMAMAAVDHHPEMGYLPDIYIAVETAYNKESNNYPPSGERRIFDVTGKVVGIVPHDVAVHSNWVDKMAYIRPMMTKSYEMYVNTPQTAAA